MALRRPFLVERQVWIVTPGCCNGVQFANLQIPAQKLGMKLMLILYKVIQHPIIILRMLSQ